MKNVSLISFVVILLQSCAFHSSQLDYSNINDALSKQISTEHLVFHMSDNDSVKTEWEEIYVGWLIKKLNIVPTKKINYYKYQNTNQKYLLTRQRGNAFASGNNIHTIWRADNHEIVHVLVSEYVGDPPKLFTEGIAVAHQVNPSENDFIPKWGGKSIDELIKTYETQAQIPPLDSLLIMAKFFKYSENITYPVSGSFVKYLLETYGYDKFYNFIKVCDWTSALSKIKIEYSKIYNEDIETSWSNWLEYVKSKSYDGT